jgi:60 kDa SS-A/Ro ribonucleoprotein
MTKKYTNIINPRAEQKQTAQTNPIPGAAMVQNNAGGFVFQLSDWDRLDRFLILGSEGNTYYQSAKTLTKENATVVSKLLNQDGLRVVKRVVEISDSGRAPKNDPAIFVLAMATAANDVAVRQAALEAMPKVCRTGTHLFHFAESVEAFRGWGRGLRNAVGNWYNEKSVEDLEYQVMKYKQRDGWSNRDLLRLAHPKTSDSVRNTLYNWIVKPDSVDLSTVDALARLNAAHKVTHTSDVKEATSLILQHNLPHEVVNKHLLNSPAVWEALLQKMPMTAMVRNLGKMSSLGLMTEMGSNEKIVIDMLHNEEAIKYSRLHPLSILGALKTYEQGRGFKGSNTWNVNQRIVDALNDAFYSAFKNIESTGKRFYLGIDVSGSMTCGNIAGMLGITPNIAAAAMALVTAKTEQNYLIRGFCDSLVDLKISPNMRLDQAMRATQNSSFGSTDCSALIMDALNKKIPVDCFVIYTDNETYAGNIHPVQALKKYRNAMGIPAKLIVVGFTSSGFTIADPNDAGMMDFVGFDSAAPALMADFAKQ